MAQARRWILTHLRRAEVQQGSLRHTGYGPGTGAAPYIPAKGGGTAQVAKAQRVWLRHGGGTLHNCEGRRYCIGFKGTQGMVQARGRHLTHLRRAEVLHRSLRHTGYGSDTGAAPYKPAKGGGTAQVAQAHRIWLRHGGGTFYTCEGRRFCKGR